MNRWKTCGTKEGIEIWRIENFKVVPWDTKRYGEFYAGDSYIGTNTINILTF